MNRELLQDLVRRVSAMFSRAVDRLWRRGVAPEDIVVTIDDECLRASWPDGPRSIRWSDIDRLVIVTTGDGPFAPDFWWFFEGKEHFVSFPMGATGEREIEAILDRRFPGLRDEEMTEALLCTERRKFLCWERGVDDSNASRN